MRQRNTSLTPRQARVALKTTHPVAAKGNHMSPQKPKNGNGKEKAQNGGNLGFEAELFFAADKLRKNLEPSDYKHVVLGLIFLRHISNAFEAKRELLLVEDAAAAGDPGEYR